MHLNIYQILSSYKNFKRSQEYRATFKTRKLILKLKNTFEMRKDKDIFTEIDDLEMLTKLHCKYM